MPEQTRSRTKRGLQLIAGEPSDNLGARRFERGFEAPPPTARPADRCEPWPVKNRVLLRALAAAAASRGVSLELAAVLVVERALLSEDLAARGFDDAAHLLDAEAARARVAVELSDSLSAYLAALMGQSRTDVRLLPSVLPLPMRLTERILAQARELELDASLLSSALVWERAAVLEGRTMSEWAAVKALGLGF